MIIMLSQIIEKKEDQSKFELLYLEYSQMMYHVAKKILKSREDAEDAVQSAFIKIAKNIDKIPASPFSQRTRNLVITIVKNTALDIARKNSRENVLPLIDENIASQNMLDETEEALTACILQLPEMQQNVIYLKYIYGYTIKEISAMLNISLANAQKIEQRAKQNLRKLLGV